MCRTRCGGARGSSTTRCCRWPRRGTWWRLTLPHSPVLASAFGGTAAGSVGVDDGYLDILEARNGEDGEVAYRICRIPGT